MASIEQKGQAPKEQTLLLIRSACEKVQDNACVTKVFEKLVVFYPKPEYWQNLLRSLKQGDTNDKQKINVMRLAVASGRSEEPRRLHRVCADRARREAAGRSTVSTRAGVREEAVQGPARDRPEQAPAREGQEPRSQTEKAKLPQQDAAARATPEGDDDVKVGAAYLSYGDSAKAIEALKRGITKGKPPRLMKPASCSASPTCATDNKPEATKAFNTVKQDPTMMRIAKLWLLNT